MCLYRFVGVCSTHEESVSTFSVDVTEKTWRKIQGKLGTKMLEDSCSDSKEYVVCPVYNFCFTFLSYILYHVTETYKFTF